MRDDLQKDDEMDGAGDRLPFGKTDEKDNQLSSLIWIRDTSCSCDVCRCGNVLRRVQVVEA